MTAKQRKITADIYVPAIVSSSILAVVAFVAVSVSSIIF